ncbi:MAG: Co2+/Mg2+ efflux protein ApaG [Thiotrichales bacterium]|nr:MAG: Co2+/Mg2+ efflux protein ApaG [Thiotrichales bacterium]
MSQDSSKTSNSNNYHIQATVSTQYIEAESNPEADRFVFAYTIKIENKGNHAAQLLSRHWIITDANSHTKEVRGTGVIGEQPYLRPGESFEYTSGTIIETPVGSMQGIYKMVADDQHHFDAIIEPFTLALPRMLN